MTRLVETFARLRAKWADDPALLADMRMLPENVKYSSLDAAKILANIAFPVHSPMLFMWSDTSRRISKCGACELPIPAAADRIACHAILRSGRRFKTGGWKGSERSYYHPSCFDEALVTGENAHSRRSCFDCGAEPEVGQQWGDRIWIGKYYAWARLCLHCRDSKFWYRCAGCKVLHKRHQVEELYVDVTDVLAHDLGTPDVGGSWWTCERCLGRFHGTFRTPEQAKRERDAQIEEQRKIRDYRDALSRGERPEHPWGGVPLEQELEFDWSGPLF